VTVTPDLQAALERIAALEDRIKQLETLLPTAMERENMRKVAKYAEMVDKHLTKEGLL
jgi:hypothetical protein